MADTNIEWTAGPSGEQGRVWNPVTGCTKVSAGCKNCYAEGIAVRLWPTQYPPVIDVALQLKSGNEECPVLDPGCDGREGGCHDACEAPTRPRRFTDVQTHTDRLLEPLRWRKPARVFVNSMSDLFHEDVPDDFIDRVFAVMALAPRHTFLILTKRAERMRSYMAALDRAIRLPTEAFPRWKSEAEAILQERGDHQTSVTPEWPLPNVHLGVSVENQLTADERIPELLKTPAAIRWVSYEPALGPVNFAPYLTGFIAGGAIYAGPRLDWIVIGGEGRGGRPFDVAWAWSLVRQCRAAGVAAFVKQLGANVRTRNDDDFDGSSETAWPESIEQRDAVEHNVNGYREEHQGAEVRIRLADRKGGDPLEWPEGLRVRQYPEARA